MQETASLHSQLELLERRKNEEMQNLKTSLIAEQQVGLGHGRSSLTRAGNVLVPVGSSCSLITGHFWSQTSPIDSHTVGILMHVSIHMPKRRSL